MSDMQRTLDNLSIATKVTTSLAVVVPLVLVTVFAIQDRKDTSFAQKEAESARLVTAARKDLRATSRTLFHVKAATEAGKLSS